MAQVKEQNPAPAQNRASDNSGEKRPRTRRPYYSRRPRRPQQPKEAAVPIHIYPLGGLGEVGKNMTVYECCGDMIIVDCGLVFPDSDMFGVDMVIPDFTFVVQNKDKIKGLLITHGHEDHIGSIPYLLQKFDLPIYGTRLTCGLIKNKLEEFGLAGKTKFVEIVPKQKIKLGCFTVEPIHVNHSIPDSVAFAIDSPAGTIIQTGDFKIDYTPLACGRHRPDHALRVRPEGRAGPAERFHQRGAPGLHGHSEQQSGGRLCATCLPAPQNKRIIIATFASNIYRVQQIIDLAVRAMAARWRSAAAAWSTTRPWPRSWAICTSRRGLSSSVDELNQYPPEQVVLVTTGSQGEPMSALSRMASCSHRQGAGGPRRFHHHLGQAHPRQREERRPRSSTACCCCGAEVIYEGMYDVHVSGHACQEEQKLMLTLTKPKYLPARARRVQAAQKARHDRRQPGHPHAATS